MKVNVELEIIVVDNDPERQAENIVLQSIEYLKYPIFYYVQPIKNISLTRNIAIKNAKGDYLFFIDDDEYADTYWITNMINCMNYYNADLVFGKLIPYFDEFSDSFIIKSGFFNRYCSPTGEIPKYMGTGNCLIKAEILKSVIGPFNPEYGLTGGEDTFLFEILKNKGFKFVSCQEAVAYEYFPPERATLNWLLRRAFRTGNTFTRRTIQLSKNKIKTKLRLTTKAGLSIIFYILMMLTTFIATKYFIFWMIKTYSKSGHIAAIFNHYPEDYRKDTQSEFSNIYKKTKVKIYPDQL